MGSINCLTTMDVDENDNDFLLHHEIEESQSVKWHRDETKVI